ncbi:hypothetical protein [Streptomyces acidiscabies]|uniref:Uncharacterized protein n=1 Tax=Streptomyces acidiscabies TaxID=42234 RepID=A0AAP6EJX3_9ACTN|nr:hypothetical protein [Streptomyces acidiscabies]MBZ3916691.1 hypothetical protein [Streptomyces acidiscabies]MDX2965672.1 hypothetical protein [Streptomyces acidiscabies]MDX3024826.1 hypothetical protein [Streptomyces acidiscabies]MDX3795588.1 hypothetical protein [Streptomyces acidiscabies]
MPPPDLAEQPSQLRALADDFADLRTRVHNAALAPGTPALRQIHPLLLKTHGLTAEALARLAALDSTGYAALPGSRPALECLTAVVVGSSQAAGHLARTLSTTPYAGTLLPGHTDDSTPAHVARPGEPVPEATRHLTDAAHLLDLSATGCRSIATAITHALTTGHGQTPFPQAAAVPALTSAQYTALETLALGEGRLYESRQGGTGATRVATKDGTRVSITTFRALAKHKLVVHDTSTPLLHHGQLITVTEHGHQALNSPRPTAAATSRTVPAPPPAHTTRRAPGPP